MVEESERRSAGGVNGSTVWKTVLSKFHPVWLTCWLEMWLYILSGSLEI